MLLLSFRSVLHEARPALAFGLRGDFTGLAVDSVWLPAAGLFTLSALPPSTGCSSAVPLPQVCCLDGSTHTGSQKVSSTFYLRSVFKIDY